MDIQVSLEKKNKKIVAILVQFLSSKEFHHENQNFDQIGAIFQKFWKIAQNWQILSVSVILRAHYKWRQMASGVSQTIKKLSTETLSPTKCIFGNENVI